MATDGVKIIDGDSAFDIYASFEDAYNAGADGAALRKMYDRDKEQYSFCDFEYEICITVYALAFWEIGELTSDILSEVEAVIAKGAGVADWAEQCDEKAGKARQKELDKLLAKLKTTNAKIKKRKKYAKVKNLIFNPGDVLAFQMPDQTYGLTIVTDVMQYRGECNYELCRSTFNSPDKPTMESIEEVRILGSFVPTGHYGTDPVILEKLQNLTAEDYINGVATQLLQQMTDSMPKLKMPWVKFIQHRDLMKDEYKNCFEKIGEIPLRSNHGSAGGAPDFNLFCERFYVQDYEVNRQTDRDPAMEEFTIEELKLQPYFKQH